MATLLSNIAEGSIVKLNENGSPVDFYVAKHNYESELNGEGRTLLVRKDCYDEQSFSNTNNAYANGVLDTWFNGDYLALLDTNTQKNIGTTQFYYTPGDGEATVTTLTRGVFTLSLRELGLSHEYANSEGSSLPIASMLQIAYLDDISLSQWTRTPYKIGNSLAFYTNTDGAIIGSNYASSKGTRPAFTLPAAETYISDDGSVSFNTPTISGEDASFGSQHADFTIAYTVSTTDSSAAEVTEKVDDTVIRTYTAQSGAAQSMAVAITDLSAGEHTVTITADLNGATAERRYTLVVSSILMAYDETELGTKNADFSIPYSAVENTDADITITEYLNGVVKRRYIAASGSQQSMDISIGYLVDGEHTATIQAENGEETINASFYFSVAPHQLAPGGTIQEFQDHEGKPVLPITLARAVFTESGVSVERALANLELMISHIATATLIE